MESLVSTDWLAEELGSPTLRIVDATWFLPGTGRDARTEYEAAHIPGALFMDIGELTACENPQVGKLPPDDLFARRIQAMGIGEGDRIVVYDNSPLRTAARGWFLLKAFGAEAAILDGGLPKWRNEGRPIQSGSPDRADRQFTAALARDRLLAKQEVLALLHSGDHEIVDARGPGRFHGEEAEPRADIAPGHIPGSTNLPYAALYNEDGTFKRGDALRAAFAGAGVDLGKPLVATCGSGVTACSLVFGAHLLGKEDVRLYDGSWTEWGADPATPKATGRT